VREFKNHQEPLYQISLQDDDDDVVITITSTLVVEKGVVGEYIDSSPLDYQDSSDDESNAGSIDSIQRNADFVSFE
jgi:hypothetical protein